MIRIILGVSIGRVNLRNTNHPEAPSTDAASNGSFGSDCIPARKINIANGENIHTSIMISESRAVDVLPNQAIGLIPRKLNK